MDETKLVQIHRHLLIFSLLDLGLLCLILYVVSMASGSVLGGFSLGIGALVLFYGLVISNGFRKRSAGYDLKYISLLSFAAAFFIIVGVIQGILALLSGQIFLLIQSMMILFLGWATRRRISTVRHPAFVAWFARGVDTTVDLRPAEVYATCPHCTSLLAVIPEKLGIEDRCPNCEGFLVSSFEEE